MQSTVGFFKKQLLTGFVNDGKIKVILEKKNWKRDKGEIDGNK